LYIWFIIALIVILDRVSKIIVQNNMQIGESIGVIPGFFHITYILNSGAAFGMLSGKRWFFIIISLIVIGGIIFFLNKVPKEHRAIRFCMGLIGGGALGNMYDRIFIGQVVDFLDFRVWPEVWSYIFNIADSSLVVGSILLAWLIYKQPDSISTRIESNNP